MSLIDTRVVNIDELKLEHFAKGDKFESDAVRIGPLLGAKDLGYSYDIVPPGKRSCPFHSHRGEEEMFFIVSGTGTLRYGDETRKIRAGDVICCPTGGPETAPCARRRGPISSSPRPRRRATNMPDLGMIMPNMGTRLSVGTKPSLPRGPSLADALFTRTQQRVLGVLFGQPGRSFYANELIGLAGSGSGAVQRELARLAQSGLVTVRPVGNQKHYQANPASPLYTELCGIAQKTVGLAEPLRKALRPLMSKIRAAFVYGSVAKREDAATSDIDLMVVSDTLAYGDLFSALEAASSRLGRPVNPTVLTGKDLAKRVKEDNAFVKRVLSQPKIWVIGGEDDLGV